MTLAKQRIVVIGGSSGMGLATARAAALEGAAVTVASSSSERVDAALSELPGGCAGAVLDVRDEAEVAALFERVGDLDHLVFTAGDAFTPRPRPTSAFVTLAPSLMSGSGARSLSLSTQPRGSDREGLSR
jgi:NAD(P)-dependent dehydrogenase (short-subunit alcohol dehydrogenase family)